MNPQPINQEKPMSITDIIKPIKLLWGSHEETGQTGQGCFMNVIAYLNGEPQITDKSPCVCITVREIAIHLNDRLSDDQRQRMIPFIERALGSADCSKEEFKRRLNLLVVFAKKQAAFEKRAARWAAHAALAANAANAARWAVAAAAAAAAYADDALQAEIIESCFQFLDEALPKNREFGGVVLARAERLCALT